MKRIFRITLVCALFLNIILVENLFTQKKSMEMERSQSIGTKDSGLAGKPSISIPPPQQPPPEDRPTEVIKIEVPPLSTTKGQKVTGSKEQEVPKEFFADQILAEANISIEFKELFLSQVVRQDALTRLLVKKGIFTKDEFLEMVRMVHQEGKKKVK